MSNIPARVRPRPIFLFASLIVAASLCSLLLSACGGTGGAADGRVRVVATTGMIGDAAQRVGGDLVQVETLMGAGVDPHLYKASEGDVRRLGGAQVIFYNGLHLEAQMGEVLERMGGRTKTFAVAEAIDKNTLLTPPEFKGAHDPHIWFDVSLWMKAVERVRDGLVEFDQAHAAQYQANAERYLAELRELDGYVKAQASSVSQSQRVLVTAHDAFNYFGRAYGFEVRGLQGISTATEAGTADVTRLAEFIATRRIPAIFVESSIPPRTVEAVQAAVRARGFETKIGGQLYSDAMGDKGTPEGTYIGMVRHNINTIVGALNSANSSGGKQ